MSFWYSLSFEKFDALRTAEMKNPLSSQTVGKSNMKMKKKLIPCKVTKKIQNNRRKLWKFDFFFYLCEKIKN